MKEKISPYEINDNMMNSIGNSWMLVTAENGGKINTMTASWGGVGVLWNKPVAFVFIRPQRYTFEFTEASDTVSLSFFDGSFKKALSYCGSVSGRDTDKIKDTSLTVYHSGKVPCFREAKLTLICKKLYADYLKADGFTDKSLIEKCYPAADYHRVYVYEITDAEIEK